MAKDYTTRYIPMRVDTERTADRPFVVAFERGGNYGGGDRLTLDAFHDVLDDYDAVIVHFNRGDHPSRTDRFLLYGEAKQALDADEQIETIEKRTRSHEVTGEFRWFLHGKDLAVDTTLGLHCLLEDVFDDLP